MHSAGVVVARVHTEEEEMERVVLVVEMGDVVMVGIIEERAAMEKVIGCDLDTVGTAEVVELIAVMVTVAVVMKLMIMVV